MEAPASDVAEVTANNQRRPLRLTALVAADGWSEFWIDGDGVVWRYAYEVDFQDGELVQTLDATLYDVGADITIVPPTVG